MNGLGDISLLPQEGELQTTNAAPGVEIVDLMSDSTFTGRPRHQRNVFACEEGLRRLARVFADCPDRILQELVDVARELCSADSAGVSIEEGSDPERGFRWAATSGRYASLRGATLPYDFAPCGVCLDRGEAQLFRVGKPFFDILGVSADLVTDGMLIPWQVGETRGTVWVVSHTQTEAFDTSDYVTVKALADFAAIAVRHHRDEQRFIDQSNAAAVARLANNLAHQINNPLQGITNVLFLATIRDGEAKDLALQLSPEIQRLSTLVGQLLALPASHPH